MKIAEFKTIPTYKKTCVAQSNTHFAQPKYDSVSFGKAHETADSLETLTFYDNQKPVVKKTITIKSSARFGDVAAEESLWVERHLTANNVTSPKIHVGMEAKIAETLSSQDLYVGGELETKSLDAKKACIMKKTTITDTAKADELRVWGNLQTKNLIATEATLGGSGIINGNAQAEHLILKNGSIEIFGNTNVGRITTYNGNVILGDISRLNSIAFLNDPDTPQEFPQKLLRFHSKISERIKIVLDRGKKLFLNMRYPEDLSKLDFFEYNPSGKDGFIGKPLVVNQMLKRVHIPGQEYVPPALAFLRKVFALGIKDA